MLASHFKVEFDHLILQRVLRSRLTSKLVDIKLESSEAYLLKLEKNLSQGFEVIDIFCNNAVLNMCRYFKLFYTCKNINNIFLNFDYCL